MTVLALSAVPKYLARLFAGATSGYLLQNFCMCTEKSNDLFHTVIHQFMSGRDAHHCEKGGTVWVYVGGIASTLLSIPHTVLSSLSETDIRSVFTPVALLVLKPFLKTGKQ